jgi:hypothetical protein
MEGLPSLQLAESRLNDVNWEDGLCDAEENEDVFALVQALDLDQDIPLPAVDEEMSCYPASLQQAELHSLPTEPEQGAKPAHRRKNLESERIERVRARNREAQARYRQRAKVFSALCCLGLRLFQGRSRENQSTYESNRWKSSDFIVLRGVAQRGISYHDNTILVQRSSIWYCCIHPRLSCYVNSGANLSLNLSFCRHRTVADSTAVRYTSGRSTDGLRPYKPPRF